MASVAVVGLGNIVFGDEGLGVYALRYFEANYDIPDTVARYDGALLGFGLMPVLQEYDRVVLLSSAFVGRKAGEIVHTDAATFMEMGKVRKSANETEIVMMLEICAFSEATAEVTLLTMVPERYTSVFAGLSPRIAARIPAMATRLAEVLAQAGVAVSPRAQTVEVAAVVEACINPTQQALQATAGKVPYGAS